MRTYGDVIIVREPAVCAGRCLLEACHGLELGERFFTPMFEKLVGVGYLRPLILEGATEEQMRARWHDDLLRYRTMRLGYLLYPDGPASEL